MTGYRKFMAWGSVNPEGDLPDDQHQHLGDNAAFFHQVLPGRVAPLGSPGGAAAVGPIGVDTPLVAAIPVECP